MNTVGVGAKIEDLVSALSVEQRAALQKRLLHVCMDGTTELLALLTRSMADGTFDSLDGLVRACQIRALADVIAAL